MRRNTPRQQPKQKKIGKKERRPREGALTHKQPDDFDVEDALDQGHPLPEEPLIQKYESPEELKKRLARETLSKI